MEEEQLNCVLITPMFSYGAYYGEKPEFRTSELKGLMRYVYRITCPSKRKELYADEMELFGAAANSGRSVLGQEKKADGHNSPLRLMIRTDPMIGAESVKTERMKLLLHDKPPNNNPPLMCLKKGNKFRIILRLFHSVPMQQLSEGFRNTDLTWYTDLAILSLMLFGIGRRSRKGRGCATISDRMFEDQAEATVWICSTLNRVANNSSVPLGTSYICTKNAVNSQCKHTDLRPVIEKIEFGRKLSENQISTYLKVVDTICHDVDENIGGTDAARATGSAHPKLASPLVISIIQTKKGLFPVYTFVKAVINGRVIDENWESRDEFVKFVEVESHKRVR